MNLYNKKSSRKGSSIIIALVVIILAIIVLRYFGFTFSGVVNAIKGFFGS